MYQVVPMRELTLQQLGQHDGSDPSLPMLLAIRGVVYDISSGKQFYGPDGEPAAGAMHSAAGQLQQDSVFMQAGVQLYRQERSGRRVLGNSLQPADEAGNSQVQASTKHRAVRNRDRRAAGARVVRWQQQQQYSLHHSGGANLVALQGCCTWAAIAHSCSVKLLGPF
jgi:predicted heme/steroid binding protein